MKPGTIGDLAIRAACVELCVDEAEVRSGRRFKNVTLARQIAAYACRQAGRSWREVANEIGYRDHHASIGACQAVERFIVCNSEARHLVRRVVAAVVSRPTPAEVRDAAE